MKKTKILITGGFGAIGYNLTQNLMRDKNVEISIIDNLSSGVSNFNSDIQFVHLDISNMEKVKAYFRENKPNYIYHLAAHFANQNSVDFPVSDVSTNILGFINVMESQKTNEELIKVIYASSSCVYGASTNMNENEVIFPYDTPYAINKYVGELYSKYYSEIQKMPIACARIFNSYGPGEMPGKYRNVIPNFIYKALSNEDIVITGTGRETRDFTYVSDTVDLLIRIAESQFNSAEVFNGGTGKKTEIGYLAETIIKLTKSNSKILYVKPRNWDHVKDRCSNIAKSQELLKYNPVVELQEGLELTITWIKEILKTRK